MPDKTEISKPALTAILEGLNNEQIENGKLRMKLKNWKKREVSRWISKEMLLKYDAKTLVQYCISNHEVLMDQLEIDKDFLKDAIYQLQMEEATGK